MVVRAALKSFGAPSPVIRAPIIPIGHVHQLRSGENRFPITAGLTVNHEIASQSPKSGLFDVFAGPTVNTILTP